MESLKFYVQDNFLDILYKFMLLINELVDGLIIYDKEYGSGCLEKQYRNVIVKDDKLEKLILN